MITNEHFLRTLMNGIEQIKEDGRLSHAYFAPSHFGKNAFLIESIFLEYSVSSSYFLSFPTLFW